MLRSGDTHHEAGTAHEVVNAAQQAQHAKVASYPVDAWLEGRDREADGDDALAPIHKVESLIDGIALKEIVAQAPDNPAITETNSMHADFGDTVTTTHTNTHTMTGGAPGDTCLSTPGVAGDTYMSTPPRTPRGGAEALTSGVGRPPILTSGQLQPASLRSTGNYGYSTAGVNMLNSVNTSAHNSMHDTAAAQATASGGHAELSPDRDVLDLSPPPSMRIETGSGKVPCSPLMRLKYASRVDLHLPSWIVSSTLKFQFQPALLQCTRS